LNLYFGDTGHVISRPVIRRPGNIGQRTVMPIINRTY